MSGIDGIVAIGQGSQARYFMKPPAPERDWRRIHHSPMFWVGIVMCLAAIAIYLWSDDLSWRPGSR